MLTKLLMHTGNQADSNGVLYALYWNHMYMCSKFPIAINYQSANRWHATITMRTNATFRLWLAIAYYEGANHTMIWNEFISEMSSVCHGWAQINTAEHLRCLIFHVLLNSLTIKITKIGVWKRQMAFFMRSSFHYYTVCPKHFTLQAKIAHCSSMEVFDGWQQSVIIMSSAFLQLPWSYIHMYIVVKPSTAATIILGNWFYLFRLLHTTTKTAKKFLKNHYGNCSPCMKLLQKLLQ